MKEPQFLTRVSNENDSNNNCVGCAAGCGMACFFTAFLGPVALVAALGVVTSLTKSK